MRNIPLSNASYQLHNHILFNKITELCNFPENCSQRFFVHESCENGHYGTYQVKTDINSKL